MKKAISFRFAAMAFLILFFAGSLQATDSTTTRKPLATLVYIGLIGRNPVFHLQLSNTENDLLFVTVKDTDQTVLFTETLSGKMISRKYGLDINPEDLSKILVEVISKNNKVTQVYRITNSTFKMDKVSVAKL